MEELEKERIYYLMHCLRKEIKTAVKIGYKHFAISADNVHKPMGALVLMQCQCEDPEMKIIVINPDKKEIKSNDENIEEETYRHNLSVINIGVGQSPGAVSLREDWLYRNASRIIEIEQDTVSIKRQINAY